MVGPATQVPVVDYLVLDDGPPHLVGKRCDGCGATYLERRSACAGCAARTFAPVRLPGTGRIESFTIVHRGAPQHVGPFISVLVRLDDGTYVRANLVGVPPEASAVDLDVLEGARVGLTHVIGLGSACAVHILERAAT